METIEQCIDKLLIKINSLFMEKDINYFLGFNMHFIIDPNKYNELIDTFNKGNAGKITEITVDDGILYISWAC